jgi:hypothetical protein
MGALENTGVHSSTAGWLRNDHSAAEPQPNGTKPALNRKAGKIGERIPIHRLPELPDLPVQNPPGNERSSNTAVQKAQKVSGSLRAFA